MPPRINICDKCGNKRANNQCVSCKRIECENNPIQKNCEWCGGRFLDRTLGYKQKHCCTRCARDYSEDQLNSTDDLCMFCTRKEPVLAAVGICSACANRRSRNRACYRKTECKRIRDSLKINGSAIKFCPVHEPKALMDEHDRILQVMLVGKNTGNWRIVYRVQSTMNNLSIETPDGSIQVKKCLQGRRLIALVDEESLIRPSMRWVLGTKESHPELLEGWDYSFFDLAYMHPTQLRPYLTLIYLLADGPCTKYDFIDEYDGSKDTAERAWWRLLESVKKHKVLRLPKLRREGPHAFYQDPPENIDTVLKFTDLLVKKKSGEILWW